jgi:hypothetical protein
MIEPSNQADLDRDRQAVVMQLLVQQGIEEPDGFVLIGNSDYRGLYGVEATDIRRSMFDREFRAERRDNAFSESLQGLRGIFGIGFPPW